MIASNYICFNGSFHKEDTPIFTAQNRAFKYGDALFETLHASGTIVQFFPEHTQRLAESMISLKMQVPKSFDEVLLRNITKLLNKNKLYQGARVRITVFRNDGGLYTPTSNETSYLIEATKLENDQYVLNKKGIVIDLYPEIKQPKNIFANLKTTNALLYTMAGIYKTENNFDDCLLLNEDNNVIEAISSNIFYVKENSLFTPSLSEGCLRGIMREQIINIALSLGYTVFDDCTIKPDELLAADEIFLTNAVSGLKWVVAYKDRRYYNKVAKQFTQQLNAIAFND